MIFITLGSQKFQFNRLLISIDKLIQKKIITEEVFAQIGYSDYKPKHYRYKEFLNRDEFVEMESKADIVLTHGGTGAIIGAVKKGKKVIAVPRLSKYGEHVDDHQLQLVAQFKSQNLIYGLNDCSELEESIRNIKYHKFTPYMSNTTKVIESIENYIQKEFRKK